MTNLSKNKRKNQNHQSKDNQTNDKKRTKNQFHLNTSNTLIPAPLRIHLDRCDNVAIVRVITKKRTSTRNRRIKFLSLSLPFSKPPLLALHALDLLKNVRNHYFSHPRDVLPLWGSPNTWKNENHATIRQLS